MMGERPPTPLPPRSNQPSLFDPAPGLARRDHPDTAQEAARRITPRTGTQRRRVLDYIAAAGDYGATDDEIQAALDLDGNTERPRRVELVDAGLIVDSGARRTYAGRTRIVWRVNR